MAIFNENIMSHFQSREMEISNSYGNSSPLLMFEARETYSDFCALVREAHKDVSTGGDWLRARLNNSPAGGILGEWEGIRDGQTYENIFDTAIINSAFADFKAANGKLQTTLTHSTLQSSPVGSAFSVGKVISGHPVACYRRPKAKLPAKDIRLTMTASVGTSADTISRSISRIAKAASEYSSAGGIVNLTISYCVKFSRAQEYQGKFHAGCIVSIKVNPNNLASLASSCGVQFFRAFMLPLAKSLSGMRDDVLPVATVAGKDVYRITGKSSDALALQALKVQ